MALIDEDSLYVAENDFSKEDPACGGCKYSLDKGSGFLRCMRQGAQQRLCMLERELPWIAAVVSGECGKSGRYFEPRS